MKPVMMLIDEKLHAHFKGRCHLNGLKMKRAFQDAIQLWIDVTEGRKVVTSQPTGVQND